MTVYHARGGTVLYEEGTRCNRKCRWVTAIAGNAPGWIRRAPGGHGAGDGASCGSGSAGERAATRRRHPTRVTGGHYPDGVASAPDDDVQSLNAPTLVPPDFVVPTVVRTELFVLEPLGVEHNAADLAAWTSSIDHIKGTPGFAGRDWPDGPLSLEDNRADLARHAEDFTRRTGFTYTVLDPHCGDVIGCVYLYPPRRRGYDVDVRSWVRSDWATMDEPLYRFVRQWLAEGWPFTEPDYARR
jgi:hypothetical protein